MNDVLVILLVVLLAVAGVYCAVKREMVAVALCLIGLVLLLTPLSSVLE